jgi:diguanylate cyclase (GGDEF)-like protein
MRTKAQTEREQRLLAEALRDTAAALNSTLDINEVLDRILSNIGKVVPHDAANIILLGEQGKIVVARSQGYDENVVEKFFHNINKPITELENYRKMIQTGSPVIVANTLEDSTWFSKQNVTWLRSYVGAPIRMKGQILGFLNIDSATVGFFTPEHAERLQAFADQAAVAIYNAQLFDQANRRAGQMATLNRIGIAINSGLDLNHIFKTLYTQCHDVAQIDSFFLALYDDSSGIISFPLFYYRDEPVITKERPISERPGITGFIIEKRQTLYIPDLHAPNLPFPPEIVIVVGEDTPRSFVGVPLLYRDRVIGVISMQSDNPNVYTPDHVHMLEIIATQAAIAIENARLYSEVQRLAIVDELTQIYNFRGLMELGMREIERTRRFNHPLAILFFDIDHFRDFNNRYSHAVGNQVLHAVAQASRSSVRAVDLLARFGGEEFVALLPETNLPDAIQIAERLRRDIEKLQVQTNWSILGITVSIGVAMLTEELPDLTALIDRANQAEHRAKEYGRNRVET